MTIAKASRRAGVLALLALACGRPSTAPDSERAVAHCERDLPNARVCTSSGSRDDADPLLDSDEDGVIDSADCCPELPEDLDGFEDQDGCPDCDNDGDGVLDAEWLHVDRYGYRWTNAEGSLSYGIDCTALPEDLDGVLDHDGCPEGVEVVLDPTPCSEVVRRKPQSARAPGRGLASTPAYPSPSVDSDRDGYDDADDWCVDAHEDFDSFEDHDGCPDCDNDGDGIPDADRWVLLDRAPGWSNLDRDGEIDCRYDPEDFDGDRDHDGCPEE